MVEVEKAAIQKRAVISPSELAELLQFDLQKKFHESLLASLPFLSGSSPFQYTRLIKVLALDHQYVEHAFFVLYKMKAQGFAPTVSIFETLLQGSVKIRDIEKVLGIFVMLKENGLRATEDMWSRMLEYAASEEDHMACLDRAVGLLRKEGVSLTPQSFQRMLSIFFPPLPLDPPTQYKMKKPVPKVLRGEYTGVKDESVNAVLRMSKWLIVRGHHIGPAHYNKMIEVIVAGAVRGPQKALAALYLMMNEGVTPNAETFSLLVNACIKAHDVDALRVVVKVMLQERASAHGDMGTILADIEDFCTRPLLRMNTEAQRVLALLPQFAVPPSLEHTQAATFDLGDSILDCLKDSGDKFRLYGADADIFDEKARDSSREEFVNNLDKEDREDVDEGKDDDLGNEGEDEEEGEGEAEEGDEDEDEEEDEDEDEEDDNEDEEQVEGEEVGDEEADEGWKEQGDKEHAAGVAKGVPLNEPEVGANTRGVSSLEEIFDAQRVASFYRQSDVPVKRIYTKNWEDVEDRRRNLQQLEDQYNSQEETRLLALISRFKATNNPAGAVGAVKALLKKGKSRGLTKRVYAAIFQLCKDNFAVKSAVSLREEMLKGGAAVDLFVYEEIIEVCATVADDVTAVAVWKKLLEEGIYPQVGTPPSLSSPLAYGVHP